MCGGGVGNVLFILITGYLSTKRKFDAKSILKLWLQVLAVSIVGQVVYCIVSGSVPGTKNIIKTFLPVTFNVYWYFSAYIVIYFLMPFINILLDNISKKNHKLLAILGIILFSVIPTITTTKWLTGINQIAMMISLYVVGNYCKKYIDQINRKMVIFCMIVSFGFIMVTEILIHKFTSFDPFYFAWEMNKLPIVVFSIALFSLVTTCTIRITKPIKVVARHTFGIYLIHIGWISPLIFEQIFLNDRMFSSPLLILHIIIYLVTILVSCIIIDYLYEIVYQKLFSRAIDALGERINLKLFH